MSPAPGGIDSCERVFFLQKNRYDRCAQQNNNSCVSSTDTIYIYNYGLYHLDAERPISPHISAVTSRSLTYGWRPAKSNRNLAKFRDYREQALWTSYNAYLSRIEIPRRPSRRKSKKRSSEFFRPGPNENICIRGRSYDSKRHSPRPEPPEPRGSSNFFSLHVAWNRIAHLLPKGHQFPPLQRVSNSGKTEKFPQKFGGTSSRRGYARSRSATRARRLSDVRRRISMRIVDSEPGERGGQKLSLNFFRGSRVEKM